MIILLIIFYNSIFYNYVGFFIYHEKIKILPIK